MKIEQTTSENINTVNLYKIPQRRPYVIPAKRTAVEQRVMDMLNFGKYIKNKEN